jgi:hypothetical protein
MHLEVALSAAVTVRVLSSHTSSNDNTARAYPIIHRVKTADVSKVRSPAASQ